MTIAKVILLAQRILRRAGFKIIRQKGSHAIMMNDKNIRIVIPVHPGKDVKPGLIRAIKRPIIKEAGLNRENFLKLLKEKSGESNNRSYLPHI